MHPHSSLIYPFIEIYRFSSSFSFTCRFCFSACFFPFPVFFVPALSFFIKLPPRNLCPSSQSPLGLRQQLLSNFHLGFWVSRRSRQHYFPISSCHRQLLLFLIAAVLSNSSASLIEGWK
ncbi:hypothetical protein IE53DRAFT_8902 [Violaceomyces palustris]|uniref:Uncharacterized protein n=1 Tax=Violaceomyces palustris TaxID=1673888 RepID=A0ACD0NLQ1_9BASI|nr:hypothetical protein IE53DRAFT_8902 [Violaceomyces palustris]